MLVKNRVAFAVPVAARDLALQVRSPLSQPRLAPGLQQFQCPVYQTGRPYRVHPRSSVTDEERAYIFQRSPYDEDRRARYLTTSSKGRLSEEERGPTEERSPELAVESAADNTSGQVAKDSREDNSLDATAQSGGRSPQYRASRRGSGSEEIPVDPCMYLSNAEPVGYHSTNFVPYRHLEPVEQSFTSHEELLAALDALAGDPLEKDGGRIVTHRGSPHARLMIIGEAPGEQEDIEGKPFVGPAGQLLDKIFSYGGFDMTDQVYVTNVAKRRPQKNRTPTPEEIAFYKPYVLEEIRLIQPAIIVLAGAVATRVFSNQKLAITKCRGQWHALSDLGLRIMPIFHPAYLLRKQSAKYEMVTDIEEIRRVYMQMVPEEKLLPLQKAS